MTRLALLAQPLYSLPWAQAAVPNQQFYGGRLLDGCAAADRPSLLPGLPNLVFLDVRGSEQYSAGGRAVPI